MKNIVWGRWTVPLDILDPPLFVIIPDLQNWDMPINHPLAGAWREIPVKLAKELNIKLIEKEN